MKTFTKRARAIAVSASLLGLAGAGMTMLSSTTPAFAGSCANGVAASPAARSTAGAQKSSTPPAANNANASASSPAPAGGNGGGSTTGPLVNTNAPVQAQNPTSGRS